LTTRNTIEHTPGLPATRCQLPDASYQMNDVASWLFVDVTADLTFDPTRHSLSV